jgi:hypothetical protein
LAATNKLLAKSNKSQTGVKATKKRSAKRSGIGRLVRAAEDECHKTMTLQEAKSIARRLGLTLRQVRSGDYRVNFRDGNETTAYYTDNLEDVVTTAVEMARTRGVERRAGDAAWYPLRNDGLVDGLHDNPKATRPEVDE